MHTTVQQLVGFGGPVIILYFPEFVYPSSNWGRVFALFSRVKQSWLAKSALACADADAGRSSRCCTNMRHVVGRLESMTHQKCSMHERTEVLT